MINKGDKILCIRGGKGDQCFPSVKEGGYYIANEFYSCPCGVVGIDIGYEWIVKPDAQECKCGEVYPPDPVPTYNIDRFRKVEPDYKVIEVASEIKEQHKKTLVLS